MIDQLRDHLRNFAMDLDGMPMSHIEAIRELSRSFELLSQTALQVKKERDALLEACRAQEALEKRSPYYFGHDCHWCGNCTQRVHDMRRDAIKLCEGDRCSE